MYKTLNSITGLGIDENLFFIKLVDAITGITAKSHFLRNST